MKNNLFNNQLIKVDFFYTRKTKGCDLMSILQEYEEIKKQLGNGINKGIELYLSYNQDLLLSDIYYKEKEYKKFEKWFKDYLKPFMTIENDSNYSLFLDQKYFDKSIFKNRNNDGIYGNGYDYENLVKTFVKNKLPHLSSNLYYDSENGMFSVSSYNRKAIEELGFELSQELRKDKFKDYVSKMDDQDLYL